MSNHPIFGALHEPDILELARRMTFLSLQAGEILFRQGDLEDGVYLVLMGSLEVRIQSAGGGEILVGQLSRGDIVGEIAFMTGQPRTATIAARESSRLARLSGEDFAWLAERNPRMIEELNRQVLPRFRHTQLASILTGLFGEIELPIFQEIEDQLAWKYLLPGEVLFRQGEPADAFYIVINGRLRIAVKDAEGDERIIGELSRGEFTGEFGLLTGEPRSATVYAVRYTEAVRISLALFERLLTRHSAAMLQFTRLIVQRVARFNQSHAARRPAFSAITVVPIDAAVQVAAFSANLFERLSQYGTGLHLSSSTFDDLYNRPGAAQTLDSHPNDSLIKSWLAEKESQYSYILYQADPTFTPWTRRCLQQADRILLVGEAARSPALGEIEQAAAGMKLIARQDLVLIQPQAQKRASQTMQWLAPRQLSNHYHIRPGVPKDYQRLARWLTGRATGLALSGGGARGLAHVGVLQALEESGIDIDIIGGTSIGALFGAAYALGNSIEEIHDELKIFSRPEKLLDYTLPFASLTASRKLTELMRHVYGSAQVEDLYLPFFCVSTNLTRAEPVVHRTGPLWESVRASLSIPGIFTPMQMGKDVLVDGGVMNNLPVDILRERCEGGYVIGVNVSAKHDQSEDYSFGASISGWQVLWGKIFPFGRRQSAPSILYNLMRSAEVRGLYALHSIRENADLMIEPPVSQIATLDFARFDEVIAIGYQAARDIKVEWQQSGPKTPPGS